MKKLLKILLVLAVLLAGTAFVMGTWVLPRDHVARVRARYGRPAAETWALVSDLSAWPRWNPRVDRMEPGTPRDGAPVWVMHSVWGEMPLVIETLEPPERMVTLIPPDADIGYVGTWTYEVAATGDGGSTLTLTEAGGIDSPFFRFMLALTGPYGAMEDMLDAVGTHFGEQVEPERIYDVGD